MDGNQRKFFTAKYSEIPQSRIGFYAVTVALCFGIVGLITGEIKINIIGGCAAIIFIHLLGMWCDFGRNNPTAMQRISMVYAIICYIIGFVLLILTADHLLKKYIL